MNLINAGALSPTPPFRIVVESVNRPRRVGGARRVEAERLVRPQLEPVAAGERARLMADAGAVEARTIY